MGTELKQAIAERLAAAGTPAGARPARSDYDLNPEYRPERQPALKPAAVLVPLVERGAGFHVLLTRRAAHLNAHAGQISFPGGGVEADDDGVEAAALRETEEEIGIAAHYIELVGRLDVYETVTHYAVTPVVGFVRPGFRLSIDPFEVEEAFEVPLAFLMDPGNHLRHGGWHNGIRRQWWAMPYGDYYIWGATAGMLRDLYRRVGDLC